MSTPGLTISSEELQRLRGQFVRRLTGRIARIESYLTDGDASPTGKREEAEAIFEIVHKIAGAAGTFGFPQVSQWSMDLEERLLEALEAPGTAPDTGLDAALQRYCRRVRRCLHGSETAPDVSGTGPEEGSDERRDETVVFIFDDDADLGDQLVSQLDAYGYAVERYRDPGELLEAVSRHRPDVVLMDVVFASGRRAGIHATEQLQASSFSDIPVIFVSSSSSMRTRLRAVRSGGEDYFVKPVDPALLAERIAEITERESYMTGNVLLVDDDALLCQYLSGVLGEEGFEVTVLGEPMRILEVIHDNPPDLVLMDLYLPEYNGDELAAVLRQHEIDVGVPIIFISTESSHKRQTRALMRGGDDFLFKPIDADELIDTVRFHLFRSQRIRRRIHIDGLTKLYNHGYIMERLQREVDMSRRNSSEIALAVLDLDDFKQVNDRWGHQVGDGVLRMLSNLLRSRLRSTDIVGRYGGEEFAVILPDTPSQAARGVMEELREAFSGLEYRVDGRSVQATFTYGIASSEAGRPGADRLWMLADEALYEGKARGKNCGLVAGEA